MGTHENYEEKRYFEQNYYKMNVLDVDITNEQDKVAAKKDEHKITNGMKLIFNIPLGNLIKSAKVDQLTVFTNKNKNSNSNSTEME